MEKSAFTKEHDIFVALLREQRVAATLTQTELAVLISENQVFVSRYERGETRLDIVQIRRICTALETPLVDLILTYEERLSSR